MIYYSNHDRFWFYTGERSLMLPLTLEELQEVRVLPGEYIIVWEEKYREVVKGGVLYLEKHFRRIARFPGKSTKDTYHVSVFTSKS